MFTCGSRSALPLLTAGQRPKILDNGHPQAEPAGMRNTYLVCYDICHDRRLAKVHKTMRGFGDHLQYSIFECQFTPADLVRCRHALARTINHREDQVLFVDLGPVEGRGERVITALGKPYSAVDSPCIVVDGEKER